jgi:hypothetical protein
MYPAHELFRSEGKTILEGSDLHQLIGAHFRANRFTRPETLFCHSSPGPMEAAQPQAKESRKMTTPTNTDNALARGKALLVKLAQAQLDERQHEFLEIRTAFSLALARSDSEKQRELLPAMKTIWSLESQAYGGTEPKAETFTEAQAEQRARALLRDLGHVPCGATGLREPDLADPRSRGVSVTQGDASSLFHQQTDSQAKARAAELLRGLGIEPESNDLNAS